jgi:hypothetical protein
VIIKFSSELHVPNNQSPLGFSLDGITEAAYTIKGNTVFIQAATKPKKIYFGFLPYTSANIVDKQGIPVPAFNAIVQ